MSERQARNECHSSRQEEKRRARLEVNMWRKGFKSFHSRLAGESAKPFDTTFTHPDLWLANEKDPTSQPEVNSLGKRYSRH
jgi:hypothetical protein